MVIRATGPDPAQGVAVARMAGPAKPRGRSRRIIASPGLGAGRRDDQASHEGAQGVGGDWRSATSKRAAAQAEGDFGGADADREDQHQGRAGHGQHHQGLDQRKAAPSHRARPPLPHVIILLFRP
jgi:hypothetical protein